MRAAGASYAGRLCAGRSWLLAAHHVRRHVTRRQRRLKRNAVRAAVCHFTAPKRWASRRMLSMLHAIVMTDALNIYDGILKLKKMVLQRRAA